MNRDEAMFILSAYRPGGADAHDAQFAEALDLAKQDAELAAWFAVQQDRDRRGITHELKNIQNLRP